MSIWADIHRRSKGIQKRKEDTVATDNNRIFDNDHQTYAVWYDNYLDEVKQKYDKSWDDYYLDEVKPKYDKFWDEYWKTH